MSQVSAWKKKAEKGIAFSSEAYGVLLVTLVSLAMLFRSDAFLSNFDPWYKGATLFLHRCAMCPLRLWAGSLRSASTFHAALPLRWLLR